MMLNDVAFVRAAYRLVLRREPDPDGERNYVGLMRAGHHKLRLLGEMASSDEARAGGAHVPGLAWMLRRYRLSRLPIAGRVISGLVGVLRRKPDPDPDAAFRSQLMGMQQATAELVGQLLATTKDIQLRQSSIEGALSRLGSRQGDVRRFRG
jgi:hypothetical protein